MYPVYYNVRDALRIDNNEVEELENKENTTKDYKSKQQKHYEPKDKTCNINNISAAELEAETLNYKSKNRHMYYLENS